MQIVCVWCQKEGVKRYSLCMGAELKSFCSEKCFAACRRAYFKRNKVSDKGQSGGNLQGAEASASWQVNPGPGCLRANFLVIVSEEERRAGGQSSPRTLGVSLALMAEGLPVKWLRAAATGNRSRAHRRDFSPFIPTWIWPL